MGYNKKILSEATEKLNKPQKIKNKNTAEVQNTFPIISSEGFFNGPPPPGANYRIPGNSIYNPTPYNILARGSNGQEKIIAAGDRSVQNFGDADYVDEFEIAKKGGEKKYSRSLSATNKLFKKNPLVKGKKKKNKKTFDPNAKYYQDGGFKEEDRLKQKLLNRYPGFKKALGTEGENLHIVADPNFKANEYGYGNIEVMFPNTDQIDYTSEYTYASPFPGDYVIPYNPNSSINKGDVFLDMLHILENSEEARPYLEMFKTAALDQRGDDLMWDWEKEKQNPDFINALESSGEDVFKQFEKNYIDGLLRSELSRRGMGRRTSDKGYNIERKSNSPEMRKAANYIYKFLKTKQDGGFIDLDLDESQIEEYKKGGYIVEYLDDPSVPELTKAQDGVFVPTNLMASVTPTTTDEIIAMGRGPINITPVNTSIKSKIEPKPVSKKDEIINVSSQAEYDKYLKLYTEALRLNKEAARIKAANKKLFGKDVRESKWNEKDLEWMPKKDKDKYYRAIKMGLIPTGIAEHTIDGITAYPTYKAVKPYFQEIYDKQQKLIDTGYDIGGVDGIWGKKSQAAWEDFQQKQRPESIPVTEPVIETAQPQVVNNSVEVPNIPNEPIGIRSQSIMEPDPNNPGKFRVKELRSVKYSKSLNPPRVLYYNPETGQETEERFSTWNTQEGLQFQDGGIVIDIDNEDHIRRYTDQGYIVEFDQGGFVPSREVKFISNTPKQLPVTKKETVPVQPVPTSNFTERQINIMSSPRMTEYAKNILARREQVPVEELQKRYRTQPKPVAQEPVSFPGIKNLRNPNMSSSIASALTQPIAGGMGSQISNVGKAGVIDQSKLSKTEKELAKLNKQNEKLKEVVTPSFIDRIIKSQAQAFSQGPDVYKATEEFKSYPEYLRRLAEKKGIIDVEEAKIDFKKVAKSQPKINPEKNKVDEFYQEINTVPDSYSQSDSLISYRNQWDNKKGFEYIATPVKKDRSPDDTYKNVKGVGHFLLDASANPSKPYSHSYNKAYIDKAKQNNEWIPTFQPVKGSEDKVKLKYKKPDEITKEDQIYTPLRQMKFSEIRFDKTKRPKGFQSGIKEVTKNDGQGTYLIFKDRDGYSRFSGGSVVFIFKDKNDNTIVRDFAGSLNQIEWEGLQIQKQYGVKPDQLTIGYHDVGSFSAKPKANSKGELKASQWAGYNPYGWTGGALLIPKK